MQIDPRVLIASLLVPLWLLVLANDAVAQAGVSQALSMDRHVAAPSWVSPLGLDFDRPPLIAGAVTREAQQVQVRRSRDSLKNGTIIGAVVGAVALGTFGALLCNAQQEPGGPSCLGDTFRVAALGAAIGAGAGLAVDAVLTRRAGVTVSVVMGF